jgi:hypothetical protein
VRSCAPLRSARWFPSDWPRCTRARRNACGRRAACDCATRDAASHTTSRLGAPARRPLRRGVRCHAHPGALPLPVHRSARALSPPADPRSPPHRPTAGQRARWWVGESSRIGGMRCSITAPRLPNPPRRTTQAMGADGRSGTEVDGPEGDRRPSPAGREGETLQPPRILVNALQHRASLFSEPRDLLPSPVFFRLRLRWPRWLAARPRSGW